ncbi:unnamed protein product [Urochloa humidicola]
MAMARYGNPEESQFQRIDACIRDLQDSRHGLIKRSPATREAAMAGIVGELQGLLPLEELDMRSLTIFTLCGISIRKGTPKEARHAYHTVGLLLLTLRDDHSPGLLFDEAFPVLSKAIVQAASDDAQTVAAVIDCLAAASFATGRHVEEVMNAIWRVIVPPVRSRSAKMKIQAPKTDAMVQVTAMSAWIFLLTTIVSGSNMQRKADRNSWSTAIMSLIEILDADDRRVRMAAGEALIVCVELNLLTGKDMDTLAAKVSDLANESAGKGADNSLLREQKEVFIRVAAFLDHNEPPPASGDGRDVIKVTTWVRLTQLNFLSKFLGNGFVKHVQGNPLLSEAFSFGRVEGKPLSIQKKGSNMPTKEFLRGLKRDWLWFSKNVFILDTTVYWPQKLLQLGWH